MMEREKIEEAGKLLKDASNMLLSITQSNANTGNSTRRSMNTSFPDVADTLGRARSMFQGSSNSQGLYRRLNRNERLRAASGGPSTSTRKTGKKGKSASDEDKAHDFALLKSVTDSDIDSDEEELVESTLKKDSVVERGIIIVDKEDTEQDIREKIVSALNAKYPILGQNDFEFVKVTQKKISIMQLGKGLQYNYKVFKKLVGQGTLYVRIKRGYQFLLEPAENNNPLAPSRPSNPQVQTEVQLILPQGQAQDQPHAEAQLAQHNEETHDNSSFAISDGDGNQAVITDDEHTKPGNIEEVVTRAVKYCKDRGIDNNPVEILRHLQKVSVVGRALEITRPDESPEGNVNSIIVDRENLLETGFEQIRGLDNLFLTLEVDFYDERAQDFGGPRKEFFLEMLRAVKDDHFDIGLREDKEDDYHTIGVIMG